MKTMMLPTIHTNGSSYKFLGEQNGEARLAVLRAIKALELAEPNGRDYYPQGPDAYKRAREEHITRLAKLEAVAADLEALQEHCYSYSTD